MITYSNNNEMQEVITVDNVKQTLKDDCYAGELTDLANEIKDVYIFVCFSDL